MSKRLRILDLGAHDGFVSLWLARQLSGDGVEVSIDGVELHPGAVALATERAAKQGTPGEFKVGLAEHAPRLFEPGTYDAVIAFELIEHVPQVDALLAAAESMLKPGGRVYVSTPDGTFGAGQNPHHLRVYRIIDLTELLRRRGRLEDAAIGQDTISVVAYTPWSKLLPRQRRHLTVPPGEREVAIFTGGAWQPWAPSDIETRGLGGSETAAVKLADALSALGYVVTVYGDVAPQGCFAQTSFRHFSAFDPVEPRAAVISSRLPELFDGGVNAPAKLLWMHDTDCGPRLTRERVVDASVLCLSAWHRSHLRSLYPFLDDAQIVQIANAIEPAYFRKATTPIGQRARRVIYSSSPDRGLDLLLEAWPKVRERVPDAELVYCYADVYDAVAERSPPIAAFRARVRELARQEGVRNLGSLPQPVLARSMAEARVWVAPSYSTPAGVAFHETFCIGAVEAAAAGCFRVTANWGALAERAITWPVGPAEGSDKPDMEEFVEGIVVGLTEGADDAGIQEQLDAERADALEQTWLRVALDVHNLIGAV